MACTIHVFLCTQATIRPFKTISREDDSCMPPISIVIITFNEAQRIAHCVEKARLISDDIVVVDGGSTDNTLEIARSLECTVLQERWDGYGSNKNKGISKAKHDWILSMDTDEVADKNLIGALNTINFSDPYIVYDIPFKVYLGAKLIRFGSFGNEHHIRVFNRNTVKWAEVPVHETLILPSKIEIKRLKGHMHHYAIEDGEEYKRKMLRYALLNAQKYNKAGKKPTLIKRHISPLFSFVKNYIFRLGFLDGRDGLFIASTMAWYTRLKYQYLFALEMKQRRKANVKHINTSNPVIDLNGL
jgi:glycosyltransferase involved in cell wall biosynthesis